MLGVVNINTTYNYTYSYIPDLQYFNVLISTSIFRGKLQVILKYSTAINVRLNFYYPSNLFIQHASLSHKTELKIVGHQYSKARPIKISTYTYIGVTTMHMPLCSHAALSQVKNVQVIKKTLKMEQDAGIAEWQKYRNKVRRDDHIKQLTIQTPYRDLFP